MWRRPLQMKKTIPSNFCCGFVSTAKIYNQTEQSSGCGGDAISLLDQSPKLPKDSMLLASRLTLFLESRQEPRDFSLKWSNIISACAVRRQRLRVRHSRVLNPGLLVAVIVELGEIQLVPTVCTIASSMQLSQRGLRT